MNKQIKELEEYLKYIIEDKTWTIKKLAKELTNLGYQKVDKDKQIVLSREEYNRLLACEHNLNVGRESYRRMEERAYKTIEELNQELKQARKETAREILNELKKKGTIHTEFDWNDYLEIDIDDLKELAKQFEVEIKE